MLTSCVEIMITSRVKMMRKSAGLFIAGVSHDTRVSRFKGSWRECRSPSPSCPSSLIDVIGSPHVRLDHSCQISLWWPSGSTCTRPGPSGRWSCSSWRTWARLPSSFATTASRSCVATSASLRSACRRASLRSQSTSLTSYRLISQPAFTSHACEPDVISPETPLDECVCWIVDRQQVHEMHKDSLWCVPCLCQMSEVTRTLSRRSDTGFLAR